MRDSGIARITELLHRSEHINGMDLQPETIPLFQTTAFSANNLSEMKQIYSDKGFTYIRARNPNRTALEDTLSYLENGEKSMVFASGMGAITSTLLTVLQAGDHILCNSNLYGETFDVMTKLLGKLHIEAQFVNFEDLKLVDESIRPNTKMVYTEVLSNPTLSLCDIGSIAEIAHRHGALLMVDNTFTTPMSIRPLDHGADIVMNSLTKFLNGHSDAIGGSITAGAELVEQVRQMAMLCGTPGPPFDAWLIQRGLHTLPLRVPRQMETAARLAEALQQNPVVTKVFFPGLPDYPQRALADKLFTDGHYVAMLSFIVPEKLDKIDAFFERLRLVNYAPTLGGIRTTMQHPVTSSHPHMPDDLRRKMGITPGMFRVSVGIEEAEDLIADFTQALEVFR